MTALPFERRGLGVTSGISATAGERYRPIEISSRPSTTRKTGREFMPITAGSDTVNRTARKVPSRMKGMRRPIFALQRSDSAPKYGSRKSASTLSMAMTTPAHVSLSP